MMTRQPRVLAAVSPRARGQVRTLLAGATVIFVDTLPQLRAALALERHDLVLIGSHFAASEALAALQLALAQARCPVACLRTLPFRGLGHGAVDAFLCAARELGADLTVDLHALSGASACRELSRRLYELALRGPRRGRRGLQLRE